MAMRATVGILGTIGALLIGAAAARAQEAPAAPPAAQPAKGGEQALGPWWQKSSLSYQPVPERTLVHLGSDLSFADSRGNTEGTQFNTQTELAIRKRRFTSRSSVDYRKTDMTYGLGGGSTDYETRTIREHVEYDLTPRTVLVAGLEHQRDTLHFVDHRVTGYAGAGMTVVETPEHKFSIIGGLGYAAYWFQEEEMSEIDPVAVAALPTTTPGSAAMLLQEAWNWKFSKQLTIHQSGSFLEYVEQDLGELWTFDVSAEVPVSKHVSLLPKYSLRRESNIYIKALGVKTLDRSFGFGLRLNF